MGNSARRRQKKMATAVQATTKTRGAKKVYASLSDVKDAIIAAGGTVEDKVLEKKGANGTLYTEKTQEVNCPNLNAMLAAVNNDEGQMCTLFTRAVNGVFQAPARVALANKAMGPLVSAARMVNALTAGGFDETTAIQTVVDGLVAKGTSITVEALTEHMT
jgi:hypothetical protein